MKVLVVDDEAPARRRLIRMLDRIEGVRVVGEAADGEEALTLARRLAPDVILLDINMPEMDGLELAEEAGLPPIIFTTAHAEHALRAFEVAAVDYLLKPISRERLTAALDRVRGRPTTPAAADRPSPAPRVTARLGNTVHVVDAAEVTRFYAEDKYTVFMHEGRELTLDESLATLEARLRPHGFFRTHRSALVNLATVRALHVEDGSTQVELSDGSRAAVGRRLVAELKRQLGI